MNDKNNLMKWIDASNIVRWSKDDSKDCEQNLPLFVRYLIRESISGVNNMRFPAGDSTRYSGWDGILNSSETKEFIPTGISFWEFGAGDDYREKANYEYNNRTNNSPSYNLQDSTFVFITPKIWEDNSRKISSKKESKKKRKISKNDWIKEKQDEGKWKNIKVYDARDIEEWVQKCPAAGIWLAEHINKYPPIGIESAKDFWNRWTHNPEGNFTSRLVLSGRHSSSEKIKKWLDGDFKTYTLKSLTKEEAIAFFCATINSFNEEKRAYFFSRSLIVTDQEVFKKISKIHKNHILINSFDDPSLAEYATTNDNYVFIPITPQDSALTFDDELGPLEHYNLIEALKEIGFTEKLATSYSRDSGKSLSVLRRLLNFKQKQPDWAKNENSLYLLTALFIGKWDENNETDKNTISKLSKTPYEDFISKVNQFNVTQDPPIYKIGNKWGLRSQYDAWFILAPFLTKPFIKNFFEIAFEVLSETDPEFFLDEDDRYRASTLGARRNYSGWLRDGILNTLLLLSVYSENKKDYSIQKDLSDFVNMLLENANKERWFSVANILPQLAEISPITFLENLNASLDSIEKTILVLFRTGENNLFSRCNHAGLLWGLESIAWEPKFLTDATLVLGKLACLDPGGNYANRPLNSLREIYLAWMPNTIATLEQRLIALDSLIIENKDVAFELLLKLFPVHYDTGNPTYKPRWRGFPLYESHGVTLEEKAITYSKFLERVLRIAGNDGEKLSKIVPYYDSFPLISDRVIIHEYIYSNLDKIKKGRKELKKALREIVSRHRSFPDAQWALPEAAIKRLEDIFNKIPFENDIEKFKWLFDDFFPNLLGGDRKNHNEYENNLKNERQKAIQEIFESLGLNGIITFLKNVKECFILGDTLGDSIVLNNEDELHILELLDKSDKEIQFAKGYSFSKIKNNNIEWIDKVINLFKGEEYNKERIVNFIVLLNPGKNTWDILKQFSNSIQSAYWKKWTGIFRDLSKEEAEYGYKKLLEHNRFERALDCAQMYPESISDELIVQLLQGLGRMSESGQSSQYLDSYKIASLFQELDKRNYRNYHTMMNLEWIFVSILSDDIWKREPKLLYKEMSENPEFYMSVIKAIYKPEKDETMEKNELKGLSEEFIKNRARGAYDLLDSFKLIPGSDENGIINFDFLKKWIDEVRTLSKKYKRDKIIEDKIGFLLANSLPENKIWPQEAICKIIEYLNSNIVDEGFQVCEWNKRSSYTKSMFEGGRQERGWAKMYSEYLQNINPKYHRTIKILTQLSESFEKDARRADTEAEQDKIDA